VFGALNAAEGVAMLAGTLAGGYLSRPLGIIPVFAAQGGGYLLAGLGMALWLNGHAEDAAPREPWAQPPRIVTSADPTKAS
jgi:hypothetical protein